MNSWNGVKLIATTTGRKIGYARVSTTDQKLDSQLDVLKQIGCDKIYSDHGMSGKEVLRPGLDKALKNVSKGDMLIVYKLDRLGRSVTHLATLLEYFAKKDIHFCSLTEGLDTSTSGGRMIYHIFAAVAEFHRDLIYENTMNGLEAARQRGQVGGRRFLLSRDDVIRAYLSIRDHGQSCKQAAIELGVARITLQRAFKRRGIDWRL